MALTQHLTTLEASGLLRRAQVEPELEYLFRHALVQEAAYESLLKADRRVLHQVIGETLERLYADRLNELAPTLGQHFAEAGENEKAARYLLAAGDKASAIYAYPEAIAYYERALPFLKDDGRAARTHMKLGLLYHALFNFQRSRHAYEAGFALWQHRETRADNAWPPAPHALRINGGGTVVLDAALATFSSSTDIIEHLFSGLVERNAEMDILPDVAQRWEVLDGGRKYIFHLRDDVRWSDGTPVTAEDFEYAWKRALAPATASSVAASLFYDIRGAKDYHQGQTSRADDVAVQAMDSLTLSVELEGPTGYFLSLLACAALFPVPRRVVEAHGPAWTDTNHIVTNGPFQLAQWQKGHFLRLSRNPNYHGQFGGNVQHVEIFAGRTIQENLAGYGASQLDVCFLGHFPLLEEVRRERHRWAGEHLSLPGAATMFMAFDPSRPPFDNLRVRRAFVLAVKRETVAEESLKGYCSPATGGLVPPGMPGHSAGIGLPYDPEQARRLLAEAGYPGGQGFPDINALVLDGFGAQLIEHITTQWREILGVTVAWESVRGEVFDLRVKDTAPHLCWSGWIAEYPDPDSFLRAARSYYFPWVWNLAYENLLEGARRTLDQATRIKMYQAADRILMEDAIVLPVFYEQGHLLIKPWVSQYPLSGLKAKFWKDVVLEPH